MRNFRYIIAIGFLGCILILLLYFGVVRFNYPSHDRFPIRGLDVSHHQGSIDWSKIKNENFSFVFIKATEGQDYKDDKFTNNWNSAKKQGLKVGAYHFYRLCTPGDLQAKNLISLVPLDDNSLPCVIDLEFGGNCDMKSTGKEFIAELQAFLDSINRYYDKKPILYTTQEFYKKHLVDNFIEYDIWIRNIFFRPKLDKDKEWTFWQYANRARLDGIDGYVDLNVFYGNKEDFELYFTRANTR